MLPPGNALRVDGYRNLRRAGVVYSLRGVASRRVEGYANAVLLSDVTFRVSEAGRQRVLRERHKNVHASMRGDCQALNSAVDGAMARIEQDTGLRFVRVRYNPYETPTFVLAGSGEPVMAARWGVLRADGAWALVGTLREP